jgi:hypothetical protein
MSPGWLTQLAPDHAPTPAGWWPPAPGWWAVGALALVLLIVLVRWLQNRGKAVRRSALQELQRIRRSDGDGPAVARAIENLMRRYAVAVFGQARVARLSGDAWLEFVVSHGGKALAGHPGRSLLVAAFGNQPTDEREQWLTAAETFIKRAPALAATSGRRRRAP